ncbi:MAG: Plug domain-containing protein, partial [Bacteroidales bacterium]|nr:Plug domain-containing protein [Bacteroidales bacterium]
MAVCGFKASASLPMAQTDSLEDAISRHYYLSEVVISAPSKEIIQPQKLEGAVLERLNSLSVADAIRFFSGVQVKDYGGVGGIKTINVRSMGTDQMGVYYNGIQLGNAQNGQVDLGKFSLENIDEISLYNGQKSDIFQSAREFGSSGSIYLNSRRPKFEEGRNFHLRAAMKAGSFFLINPSALMEYKVSDKLNLSLNAEVLSSDGKYKFRYRRVTPSGELAYDTTAVRENGDVNAVRVEAGLQHY